MLAGHYSCVCSFLLNRMFINSYKNKTQYMGLVLVEAQRGLREYGRLIRIINVAGKCSKIACLYIFGTLKVST